MTGACYQFRPCAQTPPILVSLAEDAGDYSEERCWWCGTPFPPRGRKVYCSHYCRQAAWYVLNPNALRESSARFRERNPELARGNARLAYERHRKARLAQSARWAKEKRPRKTAAQERRGAAELGAGGVVDPGAWLALVAAAGGRCAYCDEVRPLTMDHRVPLSRGGRHEIENLVPACKPCNSRKLTRTEEEFRALLRDERERGIDETKGAYHAPPWAQFTYIDVADHDMAVTLGNGLAARSGLD